MRSGPKCARYQDTLKVMESLPLLVEASFVCNSHSYTKLSESVSVNARHLWEESDGSFRLVHFDRDVVSAARDTNAVKRNNKQDFFIVCGCIIIHYLEIYKTCHCTMKLIWLLEVTK